MRILVITILSIIGLAIMVFMARIWGLGQSHPQYESTFFNASKPAIIIKAQTLEEAQAIVAKNKDFYVWLDVRVSGDKKAFVMSPTKDNDFLKHITQEQIAKPTEQIMMGNKVSEFSLETLEKYYGVLPSLKSFYEALPETHFVLNVIDNTHEVHIAVTKDIEPFKPNNRTMIQSDALIVMKAIREIKPEFIYGTSIPDIMRFLVMDSMWIIPSTQFKGDVYLAPFKVQNRPAFNDDVITEVRRRNKRIYLGPITNSEELAIAEKIQADGYVLNNLEDFLKLPVQGPAQ